jgi:hypothetical protein
MAHTLSPAITRSKNTNEHPGAHFSDTAQIAREVSRRCRPHAHHRRRETCIPQHRRTRDRFRTFALGHRADGFDGVARVRFARVGHDASQQRPTLMQHAANGHQLRSLLAPYAGTMTVRVDFDQRGNGVATDA